MENNVFKDGVYMLNSNEREFKFGDIVYLVNSNCEFDFDNLTGAFVDIDCDGFKFEQECKVAIIDVDTSEYVSERSNNGGAYAYATGRVIDLL